MSQSMSTSLIEQVVTIPPGDRWRVYHRLQELLVPCRCAADGYLWVEIHTCAAAIQVRSVVQQFVASRQELIDWLERSWQT